MILWRISLIKIKSYRNEHLLESVILYQIEKHQSMVKVQTTISLRGKEPNKKKELNIEIELIQMKLKNLVLNLLMYHKYKINIVL